MSISHGVVHQVPADLKKILIKDKRVFEIWESLTPLARNEWICWVEAVKKVETREEHLTRIAIHLKEGKRRPCCWIGCIHRKDKAMSASQKFILGKKSKK